MTIIHLPCGNSFNCEVAKSTSMVSIFYGVHFFTEFVERSFYSNAWFQLNGWTAIKSGLGQKQVAGVMDGPQCILLVAAVETPQPAELFLHVWWYWIQIWRKRKDRLNCKKQRTRTGKHTTGEWSAKYLTPAAHVELLRGERDLDAI